MSDPVKITYFKTTGKYYTGHEMDAAGSWHDVIGSIRVNLQHGDCPGLEGAWDGYAVIDYQDGSQLVDLTKIDEDKVRELVERFVDKKKIREIVFEVLADFGVYKHTRHV